MAKQYDGIKVILGASVLLYLCSCSFSKQMPVKSCHLPLESIWIPKSKDYDFVSYDSISYLIFEGAFEDTFYITLNQHLILKKKLKSEKFLGVIPEIVPIKTNLKKALLQVVLLKESQCFKVKQLKKFRYCYISRNRKIWFIEYSNFKREYK